MAIVCICTVYGTETNRLSGRSYAVKFVTESVEFLKQCDCAVSIFSEKRDVCNCVSLTTKLPYRAFLNGL